MSYLLKIDSVQVCVDCLPKFGLDVQVISPGIYFDLNRMQHRAELLAIVINIYRLLLSMRNQLPALHNLMPDNIWVPRPDHRTEAKQGHGGR